MSILPYDDRDGWIWQDGVYVPWREAKVHVLTHSLHYGSTVFEGERAYEGQIFKSEEHTKRLHKSAELLDYKIPYSEDEINSAKKDLMAKMGFTDCYIRAFAWRGSEMMGVSAQQNTIHLAIAMWEWGNYFADKMKGIRVTMSKWKRPSPETIPSAAKAAGLYMICTMSKHAAEQEGYADALMLDYRGYVSELTGANIFLIKDNVIHTPIADCFLDGITRRTVIDLAKARGFELVERHIKPEELSDFSECFITGTAAEVTPVSELAGHMYKPGTITEALVSDYDALVRGQLTLS
ncbi:branched-chain amino acid aminotransferase [Hirschia baltica]|uniref:Branched-chain-amino-acid aminotransferase n=1 Tax=Hirschia baltica (strain ATCC 49814 / DSM 5838 / IFAM 1418) TaxID=582402 RepID=C6XM75_HIRBI|nr:branched-chain amino acid aminotransferase [Hirschia baltica]ACT58018.1 branched-chain amino acid aminotransferase [Hirschia baltica ATCC 49814]